MFWTKENITKFLEGVKAKHTKDPPSPFGPYHSKSEMLEIIKNRYKTITKRNEKLKKKFY